MLGGYYRCGRCGRLIKVFPPMPYELCADFDSFFDVEQRQEEPDERRHTIVGNINCNKEGLNYGDDN